MNYSGGREIWSYLKNIVQHFKLQNHIKFGQNILSATWNEKEKKWLILTEKGDKFEGKIFVSAAGKLTVKLLVQMILKLYFLGGLTVPRYPEFKNKDKFKGRIVHTREWDPTLNLENKKIAIVGGSGSG